MKRHVLAGAALAAAVWGGRVAQACDACTGKPIGSLRDGTQAGILVMMGFIVAVLAGIAFVGGFWVFRARQIASQAAGSPDRRTNVFPAQSDEQN